MKTVRFPDGSEVPALGQGTWFMGERADLRQSEVSALREGIELGMTLIDTAEMYADGGAEEVVGEAVDGLRDRVFIVSKAFPHNASRSGLPMACEASLARLGTDRIDLYLLHWRGAVPLGETVEAMERLIEQGKILRWGVSNLDPGDMEELMAAAGQGCATNQILYNLLRRGPELDLLPWLAQRSIPAMAYSPIEQGRLLADAGLRELASAKGAAPAQIALAWVLARDGTIAIPKAGTLAHVRENREAADLVLEPEDFEYLDRLFPRPNRPVPLQML